MNPFYSAMGQQPNIMQMLGQLKSNPMQFLMQRGLNVPQGISGDPNAILQHMLQSGQVTQDQINRAFQTARTMGIR